MERESEGGRKERERYRMTRAVECVTQYEPSVVGALHPTGEMGYLIVRERVH